MVDAEVLKQCPALATLPIRRLRAAARASREELYGAGDNVPMTADRLYVLLEGRVALSVWLCPGTHCGGKKTIIAESAGHLFGWRAVAREDRIQAEAICLEPTRVVAIDLARLGSSDAGVLLKTRAAACLYAFLQDAGLCPRNMSDRVLLGAEHCDWSGPREANRVQPA